MSENTRIFPRYETSKMKINFQTKEELNNEFIVENVSLGGIRVSSQAPTKFNNSIEISLHLGSQEFNLTAYPVWNQALSTKDDTSFNYGFRLVFSKEDHYKRWMTFMKALHQHQKNLAK